MSTRCKVRVIEKVAYYRKGWDKPIDGEAPYGFMIHMIPCQYSDSDENSRFFEATPSIDIRLGIVNPVGASVFEEGLEMYVDFTPCT